MVVFYLESFNSDLMTNIYTKNNRDKNVYVILPTSDPLGFIMNINVSVYSCLYSMSQKTFPTGIELQKEFIH